MRHETIIIHRPEARSTQSCSSNPSAIYTERHKIKCRKKGEREGVDCLFESGETFSGKRIHDAKAREKDRDKRPKKIPPARCLV